MTPSSLKNGLHFCKDDLMAYSLCILIRFGPTCCTRMCAVFPTFDILFRKGYIFYITSPHSLNNFIEGCWSGTQNPVVSSCQLLVLLLGMAPQKMGAAVSASATVPPTSTLIDCSTSYAIWERVNAFKHMLSILLTILSACWSCA